LYYKLILFKIEIFKNMIKIIKSYKFWKVCICYNDEKEKKK